MNTGMSARPVATVAEAGTPSSLLSTTATASARLSALRRSRIGPAGSRRAGPSVEQHQVEVACQRAVLEAIVEHDHVTAQLLGSRHAVDAATRGQHGTAKALGEHHRLVAGGIDIDLGACPRGDNRHRAGAPAVAAQENRDARAVGGRVASPATA